MLTPPPFLPPWLTHDEIDDLCRPLRQRSAQARFLARLPNVVAVPRRPDGLPLVMRKQIEAAAPLSHTAHPSVGPDWSKVR